MDIHQRGIFNLVCLELNWAAAYILGLLSNKFTVQYLRAKSSWSKIRCTVLWHGLHRYTPYSANFYPLCKNSDFLFLCIFFGTKWWKVNVSWLLLHKPHFIYEPVLSILALYIVHVKEHRKVFWAAIRRPCPLCLAFCLSYKPYLNNRQEKQ